MRRALLILSLAVLTAGCEEGKAASTNPPTPVAQTPPRIEPAEDDDEDLAPEPPEDPSAPVDVDAMSDDELEAACFQGSTAACDRLGH